MNYPKSVTKLIENFQKLPGVGIKTAERMAFAVMDLEKEDVDEFATSLVDVKRNLNNAKYVTILQKMNCVIFVRMKREITGYYVLLKIQEMLWQWKRLRYIREGTMF